MDGETAFSATAPTLLGTIFVIKHMLFTISGIARHNVLTRPYIDVLCGASRIYFPARLLFVIIELSRIYN
jgi:hypothetical protein